MKAATDFESAALAAAPATIGAPVRSCALMAVYNEADVIREAVGKLIGQGVAVHVVDNASTDGTVERIADLVGRGVVDIEVVRHLGRAAQAGGDGDGDVEVYDWGALLRRKESLARRLGFDWYLHVDADEIRHSPWPGVALADGIARVDRAGYNLINFKLFDFRLTPGLEAAPGDCEGSMTSYSPAEPFNQRQVKAWKADDAADLASLGGHHVRVANPAVHPTRFIHKHYPLRSLEHARRKILRERRGRFSADERRRGWHVQYDALGASVDPSSVWRDPATLARYDPRADHAAECAALLAESSAVLADEFAEAAARGAAPPAATRDDDAFVRGWIDRLAAEGVEPGHAGRLVVVADRLARAVAAQDLPPVAASPDDAPRLRRLVASIARRRFLAGEPMLWGRLDALRFVTAA